MVHSERTLLGDGEFISSATMSSSDNVFSSPTLSTFSGFKSSNVTVGVTAKCGDGPTRVYNIALVMQIVQPSKKELDCGCEESK